MQIMKIQRSNVQDHLLELINGFYAPGHRNLHLVRETRSERATGSLFRFEDLMVMI
jgi:hypothetical protein